LPTFTKAAFPKKTDTRRNDFPSFIQAGKDTRIIPTGSSCPEGWVIVQENVPVGGAFGSWQQSISGQNWKEYTGIKIRLASEDTMIIPKDSPVPSDYFVAVRYADGTKRIEKIKDEKDASRGKKEIALTPREKIIPENEECPEGWVVVAEDIPVLGKFGSYQKSKIPSPIGIVTGTDWVDYKGHRIALADKPMMHITKSSPIPSGYYIDRETTGGGHYIKAQEKAQQENEEDVEDHPTPSLEVAKLASDATSMVKKAIAPASCKPRIMTVTPKKIGPTLPIPETTLEGINQKLREFFARLDASDGLRKLMSEQIPGLWKDHRSITREECLRRASIYLGNEGRKALVAEIDRYKFWRFKLFGIKSDTYKRDF
jgi:hypothetical protein